MDITSTNFSRVRLWIVYREKMLNNFANREELTNLTGTIYLVKTLFDDRNE